MKKMPFVLFFVLIFATVSAQVKIMPGSVMRGKAVLESKGCLSCHSLNGRGGSRAPDFAGRYGTPGLVASEMWNHSPKMWEEFERTQREVPSMTSLEVADLFAYFYATLYFSPRGDAVRGRTVFEQKNCISCHSEVLARRDRGALFDRWGERGDLSAWAEGMWNHSAEMDTAMSNRGVAWPQLSEQEIVDLLMFLGEGPSTKRESATFSVGEPELGRIVFERSCESCHSFGSIDVSKVDLLKRPGPSSVTGYIAAMWNHAPLMHQRSRAITKQLNPGDMRDLIAYLFSQRYFFEQGNPSRGNGIYQAKGCANCHENRRRDTGAPDLSQATEVYSPITMTSAVWRHGPSMLKTMKARDIRWPEFQRSEMTDLIAYLNSRLIVRIGR